jgi:hypothetical protein
MIFSNLALFKIKEKLQREDDDDDENRGNKISNKNKKRSTLVKKHKRETQEDFLLYSYFKIFF